MKKFSTLLFFIAFGIMFSFKSYATIHTIVVGNNTFTPNAVSAVTGDTIRWIWGNGNHTTTNDGLPPTVLPAGAAPWSAVMNNAGSVFDYVLMIAGNYTYKCIPHGFTGTLTVSLSTGLPTFSPSVNHLDVLISLLNTNAEINYFIPADGKVNLSIYDLTGRKIATVLDKELSRGEYSIRWDANSVPQGTYLCRIESKEFVSTKKFIISK